MKTNFTFSTFRLWLMAVIAAALFCSPAYAEAEAISPVIDVCDLQTPEGQSLLPSDKSETPTHQEHDPHNHTCSSCHVHMLKTFFAAHPPGLSASNALWPAIVMAAPRASPLGLFRPPRH